jgi:hypothetical protein
MEASQHSLLAACFTLHSINATLAIVPQRGAGLWIRQTETISYKVGKFLLSKVFQIDVVFQGSPAQTTVAHSYASLSDQF